MSKYKIGVFGSAEGDIGHLFGKAKELGHVLANEQVIIITGASNGLPYQIAMQAAKFGAEIWEFSSCIDTTSHKKDTPDADLSIYKKIFYIPKNFEFSKDIKVCRKYRNLTSTATCDAGIIISGRWGTMNEFTNLYDFGKVIGILTQTGGITDEIDRLNKKFKKKSGAELFFSNSPKNLVKSVIKTLDKRKS